VRPHPERLGLLITVQERNLQQVVPVTRLAVEVGAGLVIFQHDQGRERLALDGKEVSGN
jgi:hypothetical protein